MASARDAKAFDADYNQLLHLVPRLQQHAGGANRLVNEASRAAIRHHGGAILWTAAQDALRYAMPLLAYPADLAFGSGNRASNWTRARKRAATPVLTDADQWVAAVVPLAIQIPVASLLLLRLRGSRDPRAVVASGLLLGVAVVNALLHAVGNGLQKVRYALPAAYVLAAAVAWGNLLWLASQPRLTDRARRASRPAADGHA